MTTLRDLSNQSFGRLTVSGRAEDRVQPNGKRVVMWDCHCECGRKARVRADHLVSGAVGSCGCWRQEKPITHGRTYTKEYQSWHAMLQRCTNPKHSHYPHYGARGITVCERWERFEDFYVDMGACPDGMSIEREDNERGYEPGNCKWASDEEQSRNRRMRADNTSGVTGVVRDKERGGWKAQIGVNRKNIVLGRFANFDDAVSERERAARDFGFSSDHGMRR